LPSTVELLSAIIFINLVWSLTIVYFCKVQVSDVGMTKVNSSSRLTWLRNFAYSAVRLILWLQFYPQTIITPFSLFLNFPYEIGWLAIIYSPKHDNFYCQHPANNP